MTIKKPMKAPEPADVPEVAAPAAGGAAIADRFKLDLQNPSAKKASAGKGSIVTLIAAVLALAAAGILTFVLYQHWEYLQSV